MLSPREEIRNDLMKLLNQYERQKLNDGANAKLVAKTLVEVLIEQFGLKEQA